MNFNIIFLILFLISCSGFEKKTEKQISKESIDTHSSDFNIVDSCKDFINKFPENFAEFTQLYGYDKLKGQGLKYKIYEQDINYFFKCEGVEPSLILRKCIAIGKDGKWDADAIGLFQKESFNLIVDHPGEALLIMENLPEKDAASFWFFLLDGHHPEDKIIKNKVHQLSDLFGKENKQTILLQQSYSLLLKRDNH